MDVVHSQDGGERGEEGRREGRKGGGLERGGEKEIIAEHAGPVLIMRFS